jgi:chromatin segregation and condensation protein Rec8/ScpA/Scc1 (kleisin family)
VHDPALVKAVDKLTAKLTELLGQLQAISDAAAAEPILAAAATIALEATEMQRCEQVALTRMAEIEEHRQQIMQGLLEYAQRKEKRELLAGGGENGGAGSGSLPDPDKSAHAAESIDAEADGKQQ